jgi:hypothetical protein
MNFCSKDERNCARSMRTGSYLDPCRLRADRQMSELIAALATILRDRPCCVRPLSKHSIETLQNTVPASEKAKLKRLARGAVRTGRPDATFPLGRTVSYSRDIPNASELRGGKTNFRAALLGAS